MKYKLGGRGHGEKRNALECIYYLKWIDKKVGVRKGTSSPRLQADNFFCCFQWSIAGLQPALGD